MVTDLLNYLGFMLLILINFISICVVVFLLKTIHSLFFAKDKVKANFSRLLISLFLLISLSMLASSNPEVFDYKVSRHFELISAMQPSDFMKYVGYVMFFSMLFLCIYGFYSVVKMFLSLFYDRSKIIGYFLKYFLCFSLCVVLFIILTSNPELFNIKVYKVK